ncbi:MAG: phage tail assembly protein [Chloroflexota bacterium]
MQEFEFQLPWGYVDGMGNQHQYGRMRLALARDEIEAMHQANQHGHEAYLPIFLLSRVITALGSVTAVTPDLISNLYAKDLAYLSDLYIQINGVSA